MRHPWLAALSAALSEAGFGLLLWLGLSVALVSHSVQMPALRAMQLCAVLLALVLLGVAAVAAFAATRALAPRASPRAATPWQARRNVLARAPTRWHSRRNALAAVAVALACAVGALLAWMEPGATRASLLGLCGLVLAMASLGAVACGAAVQAAATAGNGRQFALPIRLLSAMQGGLALTFALMAGLFGVGREGSGMFAILAVLGALLALACLLDWREGGRAGPGGGVPAPAPRQRIAVGLLLAAVPLLALVAASSMGGVQGWLWVVALASVAAIVLERRLHLAAAPEPLPALA